MDISDLFRWHTGSFQFVPDIIIDIEAAVIFRRRQITEKKLCQTVGFSFLPYSKYIFHAGIQLASRIIRKKRIHQSLVKPDLAPVRSDPQHIVDARINRTAVNIRRSL